MWIILISIIVGCLAAFGLGCIGVRLLDGIYLPPQIVLAVKVNTRDDLANLDLILCDACKSGGFHKYKKVTVLINRKLLIDDSPSNRILAIIERYNAEYLLI